MPIPTLFHHVPVTYEYLDSSTVFDAAAGEVLRGSGRAAPVTLPGQVHWEGEKGADMSERQVVERSHGYVLVRKYDADRKSVRLPARGDRIVLLSGREVRLYVIRTAPGGHYTALGSTLLKVHFADREPTG